MKIKTYIEPQKKSAFILKKTDNKRGNIFYPR